MAVPERQTDEVLTELLLRWQDAERDARSAIEDEVRDVFQETCAIFVLDMSGFSETVIKYDILHFLARIHQMRSVVVPLVEKHGGAVVKYIGDDVVALFPAVPQAIEASAEIIEETRTEGVSRGPGTGFQVAIGIGYGPTLHVPDLDVWGAEANAAFKLGEDTAGPGQIMITSAAHETLSEGQRSGFEVMHLQISGLSLEAYFKTP